MDDHISTISPLSLSLSLSFTLSLSVPLSLMVSRSFCLCTESCPASVFCLFIWTGSLWSWSWSWSWLLCVRLRTTSTPLQFQTTTQTTTPPSTTASTVMPVMMTWMSSWNPVMDSSMQMRRRRQLLPWQLPALPQNGTGSRSTTQHHILFVRISEHFSARWWFSWAWTHHDYNTPSDRKHTLQPWHPCDSAETSIGHLTHGGRGQLNLCDLWPLQREQTPPTNSKKPQAPPLSQDQVDLSQPFNRFTSRHRKKHRTSYRNSLKLLKHKRKMEINQF